MKNNNHISLSEQTVGDWLEYWAEKQPDREYIVYSDRDLRFTWKQFNERVDDMAKGLIAIGVTRGSHVGIWAQNVPDWLTFLYATAKIGAVAVTVNTHYRSEELRYLMKHSDMHTLCMTDGVRGSNYTDIIYELLPELRTCRRGKLKSACFPQLKNVVYIGQEKYRGMYNTAEILLLGKNVSDDALNKLRLLSNCSDVVNMQYTSGTTGFPKGVMLTHHNIVNNGYFTGVHLQFSREDRCCVCVPLFHCFGVVLATMCCLTHGSTQVMVEQFNPLVTLASIHRERCTVFHGVPTMFISMLNHPMFQMFNMRSLRTGIMAGALCPEDLMREVSEKMYMKLTSVYGMTETSPGMTQSRLDDSFEVRLTTVGSMYEHIEVKVLDPATGEECPVGVSGEMCCRGYNVMKGYYKNEQATSEVIDEQGFMHSGDLGMKDANGNFRITGRIKDMIIRGGENVSPKEVEEFLYKMPGVGDVQVVAVASPRYGEDVGAFIIPKEGYAFTTQDVRDYCKGRIAKYKIPRYVFCIDEFPLTGSGKIKKFRLREMALELCEKKGIEII